MDHRGTGAQSARAKHQGEHQARISSAILSLLVLNACASNTRGEWPLQQAVTTLEASSDSNSLAAAALSQVIRKPPIPDDRYTVAFDLVGRAVALAPHRPDLLWLQIQLCSRVAGCGSEALDTRLQMLDPANGAGWLGALARAEAAHDEVATGAAVAAIGRTEHVDIYWNSLAGNLTQALASSHQVSLPVAVTTIIGALAAIEIPPVAPAARVCKGEQESQRVQDCRAFAAAFQHGDTVITAITGGTIARQVWPVDSSEAIAAREARRVGYYPVQTWSKVVEADLASDSGVHRFVRVLLEQRSEQDLYREELLARHIPLDPPPSWIPPGDQ